MTIPWRQRALLRPSELAEVSAHLLPAPVWEPGLSSAFLSDSKHLGEHEAVAQRPQEEKNDAEVP